MANHLKHVLPRLISREQCCFVTGRSTFDNIITLQKVAHSINREFNNPFWILVKIDIDKTYDTLSWVVILATITKMNFPNIWISWIKICLNTASFSSLINGQPTSWISSSRGIRQCDPISSYPFILVS